MFFSTPCYSWNFKDALDATLSTFLELLTPSWCSAFNGCKTQLHSDGAKSWPKWCSHHAPQVEKFYFSLTQQKSVRKEGETQEETWGSGRWHTMCRPLVAKSWQGIASVSSRQRQTWRWHCWKANVICLGFRVAKQIGQPCQFDQRVGKHDVTWERTGRANEKKHFWAKWRLGESRTKKLQISIQNEHVCAKTTAKPYFHFHTKHKVPLRLAKFEHGEMPKSTNNPRTNLIACDHKANHLTFFRARLTNPQKMCWWMNHWILV